MSIVVYPPTLDWSWMKQRPQQLLGGLARSGRTVYYCNKTRADRGMERVEPNVYVVHHYEKWLRDDWPRIRAGSRLPVGVWCSMPMSGPSAKRDIEPDWIVYDCADDFGEWHRFERDMVSVSDAVVCSSERLYDRLSSTYPHIRLKLVRNGYDPAMRLHVESAGGDAAETNPGRTPRAGFVGAWAPWIDDLLLRKLARTGEVEVVLVGPEFGRTYDTVRREKRIRIEGLVPHADLNRHIAGFDVCLIPFKRTSVTLAANPVKAYEYLAAGKPVVSTDLPECRRMGDVVDVAVDHESFIGAVLERLKRPGDAAARTRYALARTWDHRCREVEELLAELESGR
ncbi:glycosyltransferase [Paenibacillus flagellatus]|nr:glycosyltransferase [Paenibacillus flagellatus]